MAFLYPAFLFGLLALAIPVLIHLFNFRRYKKVYFTNVRFLSEIKQETRKRSRLKHLLILIARLLAIAALVFAFAQPYIPSPLMNKKMTGKQLVTIYVDNSFSMEAISSTGTLFDNARTKAREIVSAYQATDLFQLITNDFEGRHQAYLTPEDFLTQLDEVNLSPVPRSLPQVFLRQKDLAAQYREKSKDLYLISDFQASTTDMANFKTDSTTNLFFVPLKAEKSNNLSIDSAWFASPVQQPGQMSVMNVRIRNYGSEDLEKIPVKLRINDVQKAVASTDIPAGGQKDLGLPFVNDLSGSSTGTIEILDHPITYDDKLFFAYPISNIIPLLFIAPEKANPYLNALFLDDSLFKCQNSIANQLNYSSFSTFSAIFLDGLDEIPTGLGQELVRFLANGGTLVLFPSLKSDFKSYNAFFQDIGIPSVIRTDTATLRVDLLNLESPVFMDVFEKNAAGKVILPDNTDFPVVYQHYVFSHLAGLEPLMQLSNGDPFLNAGISGKGKIYIFTSPLDEAGSNFARHILFVPTLYKIALMSRPSAWLYYFTGSNTPVELSADTINEKEMFRLKQDRNGFELIPEVRRSGSGLLLYPNAQIREAGLYGVFKGDQRLSEIAFNYSRKESDLRTMSVSEIESLARTNGIQLFNVFTEKKTSITKQIHEFRQGRYLFQYFIIFALIFMALEVAVIRLMR